MIMSIEHQALDILKRVLNRVPSKIIWRFRKRCKSDAHSSLDNHIFVRLENECHVGSGSNNVHGVRNCAAEAGKFEISVRTVVENRSVLIADTAKSGILDVDVVSDLGADGVALRCCDVHSVVLVREVVSFPIDWDGPRFGEGTFDEIEFDSSGCVWTPDSTFFRELGGFF